MPHSLRISARDYYDFFPPLGNYAGDILSGLPTNGLLGNTPLPGILVTPACDLANRKVETATYLPIISILAYFATPAFLPEIMQEVDGQLNVLQLAGFESPNKFFPPEQELINALNDKLETKKNKNKIGEKEKIAILRVLAGLRLISLVRNPEMVDAPIADLEQLFVKKWPSILKKIFTNSYASDVHFLPADNQPADWACIKSHSLILFRYPVAAPLELFECAQDMSLKDWEAAIDRISVVVGANQFKGQRPIKHQALRSIYLSDVLTRFVAMHIRLGSPDFTDETITEYMTDLGVK